MGEFRFAYLPVLLLLIPALILLIRWWIGQSNQLPPVLRYSDTRLLAGLPAGLRVRLRRLPDILRVVAWVLLVVALARPQAGTGQEIVRGEGVDIVISLDISDSMAASDGFDGLTRLDAAKDVILDFIAGRDYDRIGLVVFSEDAFYQSPPTTDYGILSVLVQDILLAGDYGLGNRTAIGLGIATATNMLRDSSSESQVIILLTDGSNNAGEIDPITAAQAADAFGIRVYTIGIGSEEVGDGFDAGTLQQIANVTGGRYFNANSLSGLENVYEQIDRLEQTPIERQLTIRWQDQAWGFLLVAFGLLVTERLLRTTVFQTIP